MTSKRVALALGSGGARGYAHIGVLQELAARDYQVVAMAGTSMGALVGGLFAAGHLDAYTEWVKSLTQREVIKLLDPVVGSGGAFRMERVLAKITELLDGALIEDLPIPFTAVATDLTARREIWFQRGPLDVAIRASIAIPGVFTPIILNDRLLVDGGVLNPVPTEPLNAVGTDLTIAVSLSGSGHDQASGFGVSPVSETSAGRPPLEFLGRLRDAAAGVMDSEVVKSTLARFSSKPDGEPAFDLPPSGVSVTDVTSAALDTMGALITRFRMASRPPDVLISVPSETCGALDFHRAVEVIERGRALAVEALDAYDARTAPAERSPE